MKKFLISLLAVVLLVPALAFAGTSLPLITDDTNTVGKGNGQLDISYDYNWYSNADGQTVMGRIAYGISKNVDITVKQNWVWVKPDGQSSINGFNDMAASVKYRFYNQDGLALAVKPVFTFPTGSELKGLSNDSMTAGLQLLATKNFNPILVHFNGGYTLNENSYNGRVSLWNASIAGEYPNFFVKNLSFVLDFGVGTNPYKYQDSTLAYALQGVNYKVAKGVELALGIKEGLTNPMPDFGVTTGVTFRF